MKCTALVFRHRRDLNIPNLIKSWALSFLSNSNEKEEEEEEEEQLDPFRRTEYWLIFLPQKQYWKSPLPKNSLCKEHPVQWLEYKRNSLTLLFNPFKICGPLNSTWTYVNIHRVKKTPPHYVKYGNTSWNTATAFNSKNVLKLCLNLLILVHLLRRVLTYRYQMQCSDCNRWVPADQGLISER